MKGQTHRATVDAANRILLLLRDASHSADSATQHRRSTLIAIAKRLQGTPLAAYDGVPAEDTEQLTGAVRIARDRLEHLGEANGRNNAELISRAAVSLTPPAAKVFLFIDVVSPHWVSAEHQAEQLAGLVEEANRRQHDLTSSLTSKCDDLLLDTREQCDAVLSNARTVAGSAAVSQHEDTFAGYADQMAENAKHWFVGTIAATVVTLAAAFLAIDIQPDPSSPTTLIVGFTVSKLFAMSILSFVTVWCAKNYRALRHNEITARHRANALKTFLAFREGSSDDTVRNAVLLQAAECAFGARSSGFDTDEQPLSVSPSMKIPPLFTGGS